MQTGENKEQQPSQTDSIDLNFRSEISSFFAEMIKEAAALQNQEGDSNEREYYLQKIDKWGQFKDDLKALAFPHKRATIQVNPSLTAEALGSLNSLMSRINPNLNKQHLNGLQLFNQTKSIFKKSCAYIFPDIRKLEPISLDKQFRETSESLSKMQNESLKLIKHHIDSIANPSLLVQGDLSGLIKKIENAIIYAGERIDDVLWQKNISKNLKNEISVVEKIIYQLELLIDDLQFKKTQTREIRQRKGENQKIEELKQAINPQEKKAVPSPVEIKMALAQANTIDDIQKAVTPEIKTAILQSLLRDVDFRIDQGRRLSATNPNTIIEARKMVTVVGNGVLGRNYQFIAVAVEKKIVNSEDIANIRIDDYLKKYLGYDLRSDLKRATDLRKFTNMID